VDQLQDARPRDFRTHGLRNLVRRLCEVLRNHTPAVCAINATGGYKAQIAVAVLLGQTLGVPVFYKHELFDEVIAFPPLPVAWDMDVWMQASGLLFDLDRTRDVVLADQYADDWDERYAGAGGPGAVPCPVDQRSAASRVLLYPVPPSISAPANTLPPQQRWHRGSLV
jgi:hypothetical protein